jgi:predicted Zn finger-like uncharacterized protein
LIIECVHCHAKYQYDEARFEGKPSKKIRCAKCQQVFEIFAPSTAPKPLKPAIQPDATMTRREGATASGTRPAESYPALPDGKRFSLAVIDGPDAGTVHRVEKSHIVIGRSGTDIPLNDSEVSRNHAAVDVRGALVLLEDIGSTNGTLVSGERISGAVELQNHSEFQVGSTTLMLIITDED